MPKQNASVKKRYKDKDQSSLSALTIGKLLEFLLKTAEVERKLEIVKEMLAEEQQFTPASLFHRLDCSRKGYLVERDIQDFLIAANVPYKGSELKILFGRINDDKSRVEISLRDFQNFILPNQNPRLRYFTVRRPIIIPLPGQNLNTKVQWITAKFFSEIITQYAKLMQSNTSLVSSFDFDADRVFRHVANGKSKITAEDLINFLKDNGADMTREQIGCIIRLTDKRGEGQISVKDFRQYLATLGVRKQHEIFDDLSPVPALKDFAVEARQSLKDRQKTLKERYKDNKSYVKGMDSQGRHILGYSRALEESRESPSWLSNSRKGRS